MTPLSSIAMSAYTDLVRLLKDDALSGVEGKPTLKERGDKAYWYAARRVGTEMRFIYIGEDSDQTRARIDRIEEQRMAAKARQAERSRLVRLLRAEGMTPADRATGSILSAMAAAGTFRFGGTIVGTNAFRLYEGELGIRLPWAAWPIPATLTSRSSKSSAWPCRIRSIRGSPRRSQR